MDWTGLATLLENTAFPILCCAFLGWITYRQSETLKGVASTLERINDQIITISTRLDILERKID